jgi:hypothetical protein
MGEEDVEVAEARAVRRLDAGRCVRLLIIAPPTAHADRRDGGSLLQEAAARRNGAAGENPCPELGEMCTANAITHDGLLGRQ